MLVGDIYTNLENTDYLYQTDTVAQYETKASETGHSRFPIVNHNMRVLGVVTAKDVIGKPLTQSLEKVMTKSPNHAKRHMSVASIGHLMIWDGLEMMPVVEDDLSLIGIISRRDVMKAMQMSQRQPQVANTISDIISEDIEPLPSMEGSHDLRFMFNVSPQMVSNVGVLSYGVLNEVIASAVERVMSQRRKTKYRD